MTESTDILSYALYFVIILPIAPLTVHKLIFAFAPLTKVIIL